MKSVLMSINSLHNINIESGSKSSELRTRPPKLEPPFKVYTYESGALGRHKVVNEWICRDMETWRMCMGIPAHLSKNACVSNEYIWKYSNNGYKDITEMKISDLVIYDKPKELNEFYRWTDYDDSKKDKRPCSYCEYSAFDYSENCEYCSIDYDGEHCVHLQMKRPPQSWCYVDERGDEGK